MKGHFSVVVRIMGEKIQGVHIAFAAFETLNAESFLAVVHGKHAQCVKITAAFGTFMSVSCNCVAMGTCEAAPFSRPSSSFSRKIWHFGWSSQDLAKKIYHFVACRFFFLKIFVPGGAYLGGVF